MKISQEWSGASDLQGHSHGHYDGHDHSHPVLKYPLDISKFRSGYIISNKSFEIDEPYEWTTPMNVSSTHTLQLINMKPTDVSLRVQILRIILVPCDQNHPHDEKYQCHHTNDYNHHHDHNESNTFAKLNFQTLKYHSVVVDKNYRRCFECGNKQTLSKEWLNFSLKIDRAMDEGVPTIFYQIQNGPAQHGFLLKYTGNNHDIYHNYIYCISLFLCRWVK